MSSEEIGQIDDALTEVRGWLDINMQTGKYSLGLTKELAWHLVTRTYNVHAIYDEIGWLEGKSSRPSMTKPAGPFTRPPLIGLWHKHHFQARFMIRNLVLELKRRDAIFAPEPGHSADEAIRHLADEATRKTFCRRAREHRVTGEYIVYERQEDGSNYYLTLGSHRDDKGIRARVDEYRRIDQEQGRT